MNPAHKPAGKEDKIELAFKAKRANVFAENLSSGSKNLDLKKVPKTPNQVKIIRKSLLSPIHFPLFCLTLPSFIFALLKMNEMEFYRQGSFRELYFCLFD